MKNVIAKNGNLKFLYVGRLSREKNLSILIEVFNQTQHRLIIAGSGEELAILKDKATNNVTFLGYVDNKSLVEIYAECDCFVLPSLSEPWGLVVEEALSMGLPVIVSDKVGCYEDMVNVHNGIIFDATDPNSLLLAINNMAENIDSFKAGAAIYEPLENQQKQLAAYLEV
ncbi:glycosyltransferase family 4 protein [Enterobacteriaceae bacterium 4M9]|nr:glycosyltransferase family 4 protein [Enterobacteriaceae bacterium 4M9]